MNHTDGPQRISDVTVKLLDQLLNVIEQLNNEEYSRPLPIFNGSSIGKHFRHIHDFYACMINCATKGVIDYCERTRDENLETIPQMIVDRFHKMKGEIKELNEGQQVEVFGDFEFDDGSRPNAHSSVAREMLYAYDHGVHHLAIIKLGLRAEFPHIQIDESMGVAASTLRYASRHSLS